MARSDGAASQVFLSGFRVTPLLSRCSRVLSFLPSIACNFISSSFASSASSSSGLSLEWPQCIFELERSRRIFRGALHSFIQCPICPQLWHGRGFLGLSNLGDRSLSLLLFFSLCDRNRILISSSSSTFCPVSMMSASIVVLVSQWGSLAFTPFQISDSTC